MPGDFIRLKDGTDFVERTKMEGGPVDPFAQRGYNKRAETKLHNYTDKTGREFFEAAFPWHLLEEIDSQMHARGRLLGFGKDWTIARGDVIGFLGYNFAILVFHSGGPKEDLLLSEGKGNYLDSLFQPANLGQFGFTIYHLLPHVDARARVADVWGCNRRVRLDQKTHK